MNNFILILSEMFKIIEINYLNNAKFKIIIFNTFVCKINYNCEKKDTFCIKRHKLKKLIQKK